MVEGGGVGTGISAPFRSVEGGVPVALGAAPAVPVRLGGRPVLAAVHAAALVLEGVVHPERACLHTHVPLDWRLPAEHAGALQTLVFTIYHLNAFALFGPSTGVIENKITCLTLAVPLPLEVALRANPCTFSVNRRLAQSALSEAALSVQAQIAIAGTGSMVSRKCKTFFAAAMTTDRFLARRALRHTVLLVQCHVPAQTNIHI